MGQRVIIVALAVAIASPAIAARCPHGQILRVHLGKCVSVHSRLAAGYVHVARHRRIVMALPPAKRAPIERPEIEVLRERLSQRAPLDRDAILLSLASALVP